MKKRLRPPKGPSRGGLRITLRGDVTAGITVAVICVPQTIAYTIITGLPAVYGVYTAVFSTILGALFANSRQINMGLTNAIALVIGSMMAGLSPELAVPALFMVTLSAGLFTLLFGLLNAEGLLNYLPFSVIIGFTTGAGTIAAMGQLGQFLGIAATGRTPVQKLLDSLARIGEVNLPSLLVGVVTLAVILVCRRFAPRLPGALLSILLATGLVFIFRLDERGVEVLGSLPFGLPSWLGFPVNPDILPTVLSTGFAVALIGSIETLASIKLMAASTRQEERVNREFVGQGLANMVSAFLSCLPCSASLSRSAVNLQNGASTRLSGILAGGFAAVFLSILSPLARYIPLPSLAGVIFVIVYNILRLDEVKKIWAAGKADFAGFAVTFAVMVALGRLDWSIYAGAAASLLIYLAKSRKAHLHSERVENIMVARAAQALSFVLSQDMGRELNRLLRGADVLILDITAVTSIDYTALQVLAGFFEQACAEGKRVLLCAGQRHGPLFLRFGIPGLAGEDNIFFEHDKKDALRRAMYSARGCTEETALSESIL